MHVYWCCFNFACIGTKVAYNISFEKDDHSAAIDMHLSSWVFGSRTNETNLDTTDDCHSAASLGSETRQSIRLLHSIMLGLLCRLDISYNSRCLRKEGDLDLDSLCHRCVLQFNFSGSSHT